MRKFKKKFQDDYIQYLLRLFDNEEKRPKGIESKISQLISQSGLIISIEAVLIPLFYDKLNSLHLCFKIFIGVIFLTTIILIGISIFYAHKVWKVHKFTYADCSVDTLKKDFDKIKKFKNEYINDLIKSIKTNIEVNNKKATILIRTNGFFIFGIYGLILLILILLAAFFCT